MKVYYSSPTPLVAGRMKECKNLVCELQGVGKLPHVTVSSKPTAGGGEYLYAADVQHEALSRYKYNDPFRRELADFYAVPLSVAEKYRWHETDFYEAAHEEWDTFNIQLFNGKRRYEQHETETWSQVWVPRPNIVKAEITEELDDHVGRRVKAQLKILPTFDQEQDYLIVEERWRKPMQPSTGSWKLKLFAGVLPQWAFFPWAWTRWVENSMVQRSAVAHILFEVPNAHDEVSFALSQAMKRSNRVNTARAWRVVSDTISREIGHDLGVIDYNSDTAVRAMPLKIAGRMERGKCAPWNPPIPKPEFKHPDESGRVLLVSPEGVYPKGLDALSSR